MISLSDQAEDLVRHEVQRVYHGRVGGLSIFFEQVLRNYFTNNNKQQRSNRFKNGKNWSSKASSERPRHDVVPRW